MRLPTPPEIADAPELAALAGADHAVVLMVRAPVAANPELVDQDDTRLSEPTALLGPARDLLRHAAALEALIGLYVERLDRARTVPPGDVDF